MELTNTFTVPVPIDQAWRIMLNVGQLGPCMPGATIDDITGGDVQGRVKVKLGPITTTYQGKLTFAEQDAAARRVVLNAAGRETHGNGTASAQITAVLTSSGAGTEVTVTTDLSVTGKPAQFGRGIMADVSERIMNQFADNLARELEAGRLQPPSGQPPQPEDRPRPSAEALDLADAVRGPLARRLGPVLVVLSALTGLVIIRRVLRGRAR
jgi:uncharacterized protein